MITTVRHSNTVAFPVEKTSSRRRRLVNGDEYTELRLQLSSVLQTSLELPQVLNLFFEETQRHLNLSSLAFRHEQLPEAIKLGREARHSAQYRLTTSQETLGELCLTRRKAFSEAELQLLETLIGCLICPVRNALLYRQALQDALHDPLTGAGNRLALENTTQMEVAIAQRHGHALSLLVIDLDHFKAINDRYGHTVGDAVLKNVARELQQCCRESDAAYHSYRYGGEEFVMLLNHTDREGARIAAERIRSRVNAVITPAGEDSIQATISIGVAVLTPEDSMESLFDRADEALYVAKRAGRDCVVCARSPAAVDARQSSNL